MNKKLGRPTDQRMAVIRNQTSELLWYGRIETTRARAKSVRSEAEKIKALRIYERIKELTSEYLLMKRYDELNKSKY